MSYLPRSIILPWPCVIRSNRPQPGVFRKRCSENMLEIDWRAPMPNINPPENTHKVALQVYWNHTSAYVFSCKFEPKNTSGRLLLDRVVDIFDITFFHWYSRSEYSFTVIGSFDIVKHSIDDFWSLVMLGLYLKQYKVLHNTTTTA